MDDRSNSTENLSKQYRIGRLHEHHDTLRDALVASLRKPLKGLRRDGRDSEKPRTASGTRERID